MENISVALIAKKYPEFESAIMNAEVTREMPTETIIKLAEYKDVIKRKDKYKG